MKINGKFLPPTHHSQLTTSGFTLLELLVVISIMMVLFGVGFANFRGFQDRQRLNGAKDTLISDLRFAQQQALSGIKPSGCDTLNGYKLIYTGGGANNLSYDIAANCTNSPSDFVVKSVNLTNKYANIKLSTFSFVFFNVLGRGVRSDLIITLTDEGVTPPVTETVSVKRGGGIN